MCSDCLWYYTQQLRSLGLFALSATQYIPCNISFCLICYLELLCTKSATISVYTDCVKWIWMNMYVYTLYFFFCPPLSNVFSLKRKITRMPCIPRVGAAFWIWRFHCNQSIWADTAGLLIFYSCGCIANGLTKEFFLVRAKALPYNPITLPSIN